MEINASTFSDPAMRDQLQQYYEHKKAEIIAAIDARDPLPSEVKVRTRDGKTHTAQAINLTGEQVANALVSFDKWLDFQADALTNGRFSKSAVANAREQMDAVERNSPESSSFVRASFAENGVLLAYVNDDGTLVTSNGVGNSLKSVTQRADDLGLTGEQRVQYLTREIEAALSDHDDLVTASYGQAASSSKRAFAKTWYPEFDIDQHYADTVTQAQASVQEANAWQRQQEINLNEIRNFLLSLQEAA